MRGAEESTLGANTAVRSNEGFDLNSIAASPLIPDCPSTVLLHAGQGARSVTCAVSSELPAGSRASPRPTDARDAVGEEQVQGEVRGAQDGGAPADVAEDPPPAGRGSDLTCGDDQSDPGSSSAGP
jgi:hypothetical protein